MNIYDFNDCQESGREYGGAGGLKKGIVLDNQYWFLKYPKKTSDMNNVKIAYTTTPLSEYLGSQIYQILGYPVHETMMGIADGKLVTACKDFLELGQNFYDFQSIRNHYIEENAEYFEQFSSDAGDDRDFKSTLLVLKNNFSDISEASDRFWDMFVIDAFINNNDRNNGNWGYVSDTLVNKKYMAPIFDQGASFYNKKCDQDFKNYMSDDRVLRDNALRGVVSCFKDNGKPIHPFILMETSLYEFPDLAPAITRNSVLIDENYDRILSFIKDIPDIITADKEYLVMSDVYKEYVMSLLDIRKEKLNELANDIERTRNIDNYNALDLGIEL